MHDEYVMNESLGMRFVIEWVFRFRGLLGVNRAQDLTCVDCTLTAV